MEGPLLDRTYELLGKSDLPYRAIATGAAVGIDWLKSFSARRIQEPGVEKVQRLHDFLVAYEAIRAPKPTQRVAAN